MAASNIPGIHFLNQLRDELHEDIYDSRALNLSLIDRGIALLSHKILCLACLVVNAAVVVSTLAAFTLISCPLGLLKIFVFAITAGRVQWQFTTFANALLKQTVHGAVDLFWSLAEPLIDGAYLMKQSYRLALRAVQVLGVWLPVEDPLTAREQGFVQKMLKASYASTLGFLLHRLTRGVQLARASEEKRSYDPQTPRLIRALDDYTRAISVMSRQERSLGEVLLHFPLSIVNGFANMAFCLLATMAALAASALFLAKVILGVFTGRTLALASLAPRCWNSAIVTARNLLYDLISDGLDVAIVLFKLAQVLKLHSVMLSLSRLITYSRKAIFS